MHFAILIVVIVSAWKWSDWKNWTRYLPSMQFITIGALLYEYITMDQKMWFFLPDIPHNQTLTTVMHTILTMPLTVLIYLSNYPKRTGQQIVHIFLWIAVYSMVEAAMMITDRISYDNGWNLWHSVLFDFMMFPMLRLHHTRPLWAYILSVPIVLFLIYWFNIYVT